MTEKILVRVWEDSFVINYMHDCIISDKGVPVFIKEVYGAPLPEDLAILACRDFDNQEILPSYMIIIPKEIKKVLETKESPKWKAVYKYLVEKYISKAEERSNKYQEKK